MNLINRKIKLFCISNIMISFACTNFIGSTYSINPIDFETSKEELEIASSDLEPVSQLGDEKVKTLVSLIEEAKQKEQAAKKKTTKVVTKKEVASTVRYVPAKYDEVTGKAIVDYAMKYLGLNYVSGGYSLSTGTDCSGFTKLIYKEFGIELSRVVSGQKNSGTYVSKSDLNKGDLVFYGSGSRSATHVAIYIGNGQVIHESNHRDGVKISSVNMMTYITARRVINSTAKAIANEKNNVENVSNDASVANNTVLNDTTSDNNANSASLDSINISNEDTTISTNDNAIVNSEPIIDNKEQDNNSQVEEVKPNENIIQQEENNSNINNEE